MVSTETWMGSGQSVTLAPESELFLGYMPLGPTLGMANTNKAHLIKYSVGYALDGTNVTIGTTKLFSDYYELVPDLYTGCTAEFYYSDSGTDAATLKFSAVVAGNDTDAIYFSGNILDYPSLYNKDTNATPSNPRGYIILTVNGSVVPAPNSYELIDNSITSTNVGDATIGSVAGNGQKFVVGDIIRNSSGTEVGRVITSSTNGTLTSTSGPDTTDVLWTKIVSVEGDGSVMRIWRHNGTQANDDVGSDVDSSCIFYFNFNYSTDS